LPRLKNAITRSRLVLSQERGFEILPKDLSETINSSAETILDSERFEASEGRAGRPRDGDNKVV